MCFIIGLRVLQANDMTYNVFYMYLLKKISYGFFCFVHFNVKIDFAEKNQMTYVFKNKDILDECLVLAIQYLT